MKGEQGTNKLIAEKMNGLWISEEPWIQETIEQPYTGHRGNIAEN